MAKQFDQIDATLQDFIEAQPMFFVGSAAEEGRVNISPKGMDSLRVMGPNRVVWRNLTGSGNETQGHLKRVNRITLMWCSYGVKPMILRCYGTARCVMQGDADWDTLNGLFAQDDWARQVYDVAVDLVQTSCGYAVPRMTLDAQRDTLDTWGADRIKARGPGAVRDYWVEKNQTTIDGFETGVLDER